MQPQLNIYAILQITCTQQILTLYRHTLLFFYVVLRQSASAKLQYRHGTTNG